MSEKEEIAFWVVTSEYIGNSSNLLEGDPRALHTAWVQRVPPTTNLSHEIRDKGWLGATNDWSYCSHGKFSSRKEAIEFIENLLEGREYDECEDPRSNGCDYDEEIDSEIWTLCQYDSVWNADDWLRYIQDAELGINIDMTDEEIDELVNKLEDEALKEGRIQLNGLKEYIRKRKYM